MSTIGLAPWSSLQLLGATIRESSSWIPDQEIADRARVQLRNFCILGLANL